MTEEKLLALVWHIIVALAAIIVGGAIAITAAGYDKLFVGFNTLSVLVGVSILILCVGAALHLAYWRGSQPVKWSDKK